MVRNLIYMAKTGETTGFSMQVTCGFSDCVHPDHIERIEGIRRKK